MATSWNIPALVNKILYDLPGIRTLLQALAKMDYTGTTDIPTGSVRMAQVEGGWQLQRYNGTSWISVGKLIHDADSVDGKSASTTATADTIPVRDSSGKIPGDITGNAASADSAAALSTTLTVGSGGTGSTTPEGARSNLGVPPTNHASTGTTYGLSSANQYGHAMASSNAPAQDTDTGAVGVDESHFARADHAHKKVLGNANTYGQVKLTDSVSDGSAASSSVAASAKAVKTAYDKASALMIGATASAPGTSGNVPAPQAGAQNKAFFGDGKYYDVVRSVGGSVPDANGNVNAPYLSMYGGNVIGAIKLYTGDDYIGNIVATNDTISGKSILIDTWEQGDIGAFLRLQKGSDTTINNPGGFFLVARNEDGTIYRSLVGQTNGDLWWDNKRIVRSLNGVGADINGNINLGGGVIYTIGIISPSNSTGTWIPAPPGNTPDVTCSMHACMFQQRVDDDDKIVVGIAKEGNGWRVRGYTSQRDGDGEVIYFIILWR